MATIEFSAWGLDTGMSGWPFAIGTFDVIMSNVDFINIVSVIDTLTDPNYHYSNDPVTFGSANEYTKSPTGCYLVGKLSEGQSAAAITSYSVTPTDYGEGSKDGRYVLEQSIYIPATCVIRNGYAYYCLQFPGLRRGGFMEAADEYETFTDFTDAMDSGSIEPATDRIVFDIYVNGSNEPNIQTRWQFNNRAEQNMSSVLIQPKIWYAAPPLLGSDIKEEGGINVPNTDEWYVESAGTFPYAGYSDTTYLSIVEQLGAYLNSVNRVVYWGLDGVPGSVRLLIRADYEDEIGQLFRVTIPKAPQSISDLTLEAVANSSTATSYETKVIVHYGEEPDGTIPDDADDYPEGSNIDGDGDGRYDPDDIPDPDDFSDTSGLGFDGNAVLTKTYAVSAATLQNIGQKLWSQDYFNVLKIQNNPMENIVSVKSLPFAMVGTAEEIKVGDVAFGVNGDKVASVQKKTIGTVKYSGHFGNYLDLSPFTICKVYLPYIGLIQVDASEIYNSTLKVEYVIDLVTGQCMAILTLDTIPYMNVFGTMGVDVPLSSTDRVQTELRAASVALSSAAGAAGHLMAGDTIGAGVSAGSSMLSLVGTDYNSQRTSNQSPACTSFENHMVFLQIERPLMEYVEPGAKTGYKHLHGYPCHKYKKLSELSGFVAVDRRTDINIAMTSEENAMLERMLTEGVYV